MAVTPKKGALGLVIGDDNADRVRRHHDQQIAESQRDITTLQKSPATETKIIHDILLVDTVETPVEHGLGRAPLHHSISSVRGPAGVGIIEEVRSAAYDPAKVIVLKATSYSANVIIDLAVM